MVSISFNFVKSFSRRFSFLKASFEPSGQGADQLYLNYFQYLLSTGTFFTQEHNFGVKT